MDNFEKRKYLEYASKMCQFAEIGRYGMGDVARDWKEVFNISIDTPSDNSRHSMKEMQQYREKIIKALSNKLNNMKPVKTEIEKKIEIISKFYHLTNLEKELFIYMILSYKCDEFENFNELFNNDRHMHYFSKYCLKLRSYSKLSRIYVSMVNKGVMVEEGDFRRRKEINPALLSIFDNGSKADPNVLKQMLLGKVEKSELDWEDFNYIEKERDLISKIVKSSAQKKPKGVNILLYGEPGTGKTQFARLICEKLNVELFSVASDINGDEATRSDRITDFKSKQTILSKFKNSCVLFDEAEDMFNRRFDSKAFLNALLEENTTPVFWTTNNTNDVDPAILRRMTYAVYFEKQSEETRLKIWKKIVKKNKIKVDEEKLKDLSNAYDISPALITNAVKTTKLIKGNQGDFEYFIENVARVVAKKTNVKKEKIKALSEYNDEIVNADINLKQLTSKIKETGKLNFSMCLYGEPGTGKSLYARYLANELGIEVVFKRASDLMSMWVGATEKNIAEAFREAKQKGAMLIIDEADSFLRSRGNAVRSWEVAQVNEMLTWMESHNYPFVCTTNLLDMLDEASLRRFTFKIKFDFMNKIQLNKAIEHFFNIENSNLNIKGLTAGDFATVKKKAEFLEIKDIDEIEKMLLDEVKVKQSKELKSQVGF